MISQPICTTYHTHHSFPLRYLMHTLTGSIIAWQFIHKSNKTPPAAVSTTRGGRDRTLRALANQCSKPPPDLTPNAAIRSAALSRRAGHVRQSQTKLIRRVVWIITTPLGGLTETLSGGPVLVPWCPGWCRCTPVAGRWGGFVVVVEGRISGLRGWSGGC